MDAMSSETNDKNDHIERPVRRRHSSILKPPRSPLRDIRDGNEIVQEPNALRNKKSSRRVSFADTIKVFQAESHTKIVRKSEIAETEARENVLFMQNNNSEDNYCEIIGMNTLLCAPIQTQMQQREVSVTEHNHGKKHSCDQTVIFSDENQMDLTASHTVMITKGLLDYTKNEKSTKIDTTAFLANLKLHTEDSRIEKELNFSMDQNTNSEKKINFNDFIKRLKTRKSNASCTGPDKENSEISIHSKESNRTSSVHQMHESFHVDETGSNMTRIFREQDDEMDFTHCHTANIQNLLPTSSEANLREFKSDDITVYGSDLMDLTRNHTIQILPSADNLPEIENQTQTVMMDVTTDDRTKASEKKSVFENKPNAAFQDPSLNPKGEIHITRSDITGTETQMVTQPSNQDISTLAVIPESICSSTAIQDYKTFLYSSCNNAMELTKCLSSTREEKNLLKHDSNYAKMYPNPDVSSLLTENTIYSGEDSMDITKSHTVAIDNQIFKQDQTDVRIAIPISEKEMLQNHIIVSKDKEFNVNCSSVLDVSRETLKQGLANPSFISLTGKKNVIFTGEDNDLTKSHKTNLGSQAPSPSYNLASEDINKSHSDSNGLLNELEKMTKSHFELSQQPNIISQNFLTDTWRREKDPVLEVSPYLDEVSPQSVNINQDSAKYNILYSGGDLNKQVALGNNRNTVSCEQSMFPTTKLFSSEGQCTVKNHNTAIDSHIVKSVPGQNSKLPEPLRKSLGNPALDCSHDKIIICSEEEQNMDLTKSHTVVIGFGPSEVQELDKTNLGNSIRHEAVKVENYNKTPTEKSGVFIFNDMDTLEDKCIQQPGFLNENQDVQICERKSIDRLKIDKTVIFSEGDENNMDITKSYTLEINHRPLLDEPDSHLVPSAGTSKTVLYAYGQDDMEVTRSHTTAIEFKTVSPDEITTRPVDKTVMFIGNHDELEMTKSHTVFIDYQAKERTVLPERPDFELSKKKGLGKSTVTPYSEDSVFFPENVKSDNSAARVSQLTRERSNSGSVEKAVAVIANGNMEVSTSTIWKNNKDVPKPRFLNEPLSDISQRRKSLRFKNDKSIALSSNHKNDMDIIQSCTEINNKSAVEDEEDLLLVPLAGTSKTVLYTCGQDDMEITRSHTTALECKTVSPVKITSKPMQNTIMFFDNHNDMEVTKSHNAFIDCQATEKILQEYSNFGTAKGETLGVSFPKDGRSVQEITEKQVQAVENKVVLHTEQKHHVIAFSNTFSGDQGEREIVKFYSTAVDEKDRGGVVGQADTLEKAKLESCHLSSTARRNVDFTNSHAPAICESSNNYSCLPNVISYFDNLEGNVMSLHDKDEKASNCPVQNGLAYANNLAREYYLKSEGLLLSDSCSLLEKEKITQTDTKGQSDCVITVLKDQDLITEPQNLLANQTLVCGQDLRNMTKLDSMQVSLKFPEDQMETFVHNAEHSLKPIFVDDVCIGSQPHLSKQLSPLPQQGQSVVNKDESKTLNIVTRNSSVPIEELSKNKSIMLNNEKQFTVACEEEPKKNIQTAKCNIAIDFCSNSDLTKQVVQTHDNPKETSNPIIASNTASFSSGKPNVNNLNKETEKILDLQTVCIPAVPEQLLELVNNADNDVSRVQATEICNMNTVSNNVKDDRDENKFFHNESETNSLPLVTFVKDKVRRCSLGIFLPRLPNKRNCSVTGIDDLEQVPSDTADLNHLETQLVSNKDLGIGFIAAKLNLSPSQYINEENLPIYPGEINSSDSISIETEEKSLIKTYEKEISPPENKMKETCNSQKRTWVQEDDDDIQNEKKIRKREIKCTDTTQDQEIFIHHAEGDIDKNGNSILIKSLSRTPSSCSSSLDSIKTDGTSVDCSTYRSSQMESQFLTDTICEESLKEKLKDGRITIKEFFILLQVHILIQKPRQSTLPAKFAINTQSTSEDLMLSQYVYRPKIQIYREDCEALRQKIEELKLSALNQDKLLTNVNRNLWEKMRHCCDEELKAFGIYLNKIKSHFTKMTKVFTHQGKVALYSKLVKSAQNEREKLQVRIEEMDNILKKMDSCLTEVKLETKNLESEEKYNFVEEWDSEMRAAEKELEQLKTEEEELQRSLLEVEVQKEQTLAQIDFVQKQISTTEELLDQLSLSEWDVIEWSDDQAIFTFLYDTIELIITFGEPVDGLPFVNNAYRRIVDLNFQSLLDEEKAPPSSLLVHKLIFQYIEEQESWKKKCTTQHQVSKMLQEISMVVSHCRLLGEEIEFLQRWGPNYNLMHIDVNDTELSLLFSSSAAFAKFEITLSLSAHYPSVLLPFSIKNHLGNISHSEISALLFKVPLEDNYLKNVVKQIYRDLLQG
ncbi:kinetochore scaffold 1 [Artibeus jamaicensis]|uniref:kinetochore scaffold 1 n=1 Tax=Artibeus jamaicensis TaxID=9417 RepID=UPI00235AAC24|nr:kinetochore scaffold 1 [Artibeus jamaicensis]XP_037017695.2 kinetochore scaffold 1 [Artibeus jamaicensis]XP_037017696.2 kinetochore scaffold 1 [Artibeus jamaicensis]XP_053522291.1 kinetochore scaffold 1 [Artibeus jamaicensis]